MKAKILFIALFILNIFQVSAQNTDEVTLVVSADGATKEEATKVALRSAIEQAYGTFVSANTTILNDNLVKDEIVTISTGNIKNYKELSSFVMPNGKQSVTLQTTVCISKLISYAQSKGASTEFAGATFGMNMKMKELNKQNEKKALNNLLSEITDILPSIFELKLFVGNPINQENGNYRLPMLLLYEENETQKNLDRRIQSTLKSLSLSKEEITEYRKMGLETYEYFYDMLHCIIPFYYSNPRGVDVVLRNEVADYTKNTFGSNLKTLLRNEVLNFEIIDNNEKKYDILPFDRRCVYVDKNNGGKVFNQNYPSGEADNVWDAQVINIAKEIVNNGIDIKFLKSSLRGYNGRDGFSLGHGGSLSVWFYNKSPEVSVTEEYISGANFLLGFSIEIPKEDMMKIANFSVQRKK